jgi:hypothetical protein
MRLELKRVGAGGEREREMAKAPTALLRTV